MAGDHVAPEAGQLSRAWTGGHKEKIAKEQVTQRVCSWTVRNEMRGVLGGMFTSAARRIFNSANSREIRALQKTVSIAAKTRKHRASVMRKLKFLDGNRGNLCVKEFK